MDVFKEYMKGDVKKHPLKPRAISSYASSLRRVPGLLNLKEETFFKMSSPEKLHKLLERLISSDKFKTEVRKKSQGNILTAFRRYIESIENLEKVKVRTREFLLELSSEFVKYRKKNSRNRETMTNLADDLNLLLETDLSSKTKTKPIWKYAGLKNKSQVRLIHQVQGQLQKGKYHAMVAMEPVATAKVLAIQMHIRLVQELGGLSSLHE
jgi:hypothetical protein